MADGLYAPSIDCSASNLSGLSVNYILLKCPCNVRNNDESDKDNKKLSRRRETARRVVSFNISLRQSRLFEMIPSVGRM